MQAFQGRIAIAPGGGATLISSGLPVDEALRRLESGVPASDVFGEDAVDLAAAVAWETLGDDGAEGPTLVRRPPARPRLAAAASEERLAEMLPSSARPARLALAAGLLQVLDAWDASHEAAQEADDLGERAFSAYWHGIAHRREPDAGNAAYWFRRVGRHPLFPAVAAAAGPLLEACPDDEAAARVLGRDGWDPLAFVRLCDAARPGSDRDVLARKIQRSEMALLLEATARAAGDELRAD